MNGTSIMKKDDGRGHPFLSQICGIYFIRGNGDDDDITEEVPFPGL